MGNYASCTLSVHTGRSSSGATVVRHDGEISHLGCPVSAAELMLESPNHFLARSRSMDIGRRLSALPADEELEKGEVYVFFPMSRVGSKITPADMGRLLLDSRRPSCGKFRISPESVAVVSEQGAAAGSDEEVDALLAEVRFRESVCRFRRPPPLETIAEEAQAVF